MNIIETEINYRETYKRAVVGAWYRVPGLERLQRKLVSDPDIGPDVRDELTAVIQRRIGTLVDATLRSVDEL